MLRTVIIILLLLFPFFSHSQSLKSNFSTEEKTYMLSKVWKEVHYNFAFIDQITFDLDSLYQESLKRVITTKNNFEYINELRFFLDQLNDGHTSILTDQWYWDQADYPAVFTKTDKGKEIVSQIAVEYAKEIPLGSELIEIDNIPISLAKSFKYSGLLGIRDSKVELKFKTPNSEEVVKDFARDYNKRWKVGNIEMKSDKVKTKEKKPWKAFDFYISKEKISIVTINTFQNHEVVDNFKKMIDTINNTKGIIIDVRENYGGNSDYALEIAKHLVKQDYVLTESWKTRAHNAAKKAWASINHYNPENSYAKKYKDYYNAIQWETHEADTIYIPLNYKKIKVPIIILSGTNTFSAAEDFLIYTNNDTSIKRVGRPSAGSSGQPLRVNLHQGLYARICAKRDALPDGTDYIGIGIKPHILVSKNKNPFDFAIKHLIEK